MFLNNIGPYILYKCFEVYKFTHLCPSCLILESASTGNCGLGNWPSGKCPWWSPGNGPWNLWGGLTAPGPGYGGGGRLKISLCWPVASWLQFWGVPGGMVRGWSCTPLSWRMALFCCCCLRISSRIRWRCKQINIVLISIVQVIYCNIQCTS